MKDVYTECLVLEDETYRLHFVELGDAKDLLKVYSDDKAVPYFNSDNCNGDNFFYTTLERMEQAVKFWTWAYENKGFVRWSIVDKVQNETIGTIELFHRDSADYFNSCGLLRLDLRSDHEKQDCINEILLLILAPAYEMFHCSMIATKAAPFAKERIQALERSNFVKTRENLVGHDGTNYGDYWICRK